MFVEDKLLNKWSNVSNVTNNPRQRLELMISQHWQRLLGIQNITNRSPSAPTLSMEKVTAVLEPI